MYLELGFPYSGVLGNSIGERFEGSVSKGIVLNFLLSDLQAARILYVKKPKQLQFHLVIDSFNNESLYPISYLMSYN